MFDRAGEPPWYLLLVVDPERDDLCLDTDRRQILIERVAVFQCVEWVWGAALQSIPVTEVHARAGVLRVAAQCALPELDGFVDMADLASRYV